MKSLIPVWLRMVINQTNVINVFILNYGIIYMSLLAFMWMIYWFFGSNMHVINETKKMLKSHFDMKDLGETNFILGMKITKTCDEIYLDQSHYVEKILRDIIFMIKKV